MEDLDATENGRDLIPEFVGEEKNESEGSNRTERSKTGSQRRRGNPWSEEEHSLFFADLEKHGRGDWRSISREFVKTRNPTQVASHAQKYYNRIKTNSTRKRSSIHDIRNSNDEAASPQNPMARQNNMNPSPQFGPSPSMTIQLPTLQHHQLYQHHQQMMPLPLLNTYGNSVGRPMQGHMASVVGTPVMLPNGFPRNVPYNMPNSLMIQP